MRGLPPLACEGAGGTSGSTRSQNSSLTVQGLVRAICSLPPEKRLHQLPLHVIAVSGQGLNAAYGGEGRRTRRIDSEGRVHFKLQGYLPPPRPWTRVKV